MERGELDKLLAAKKENENLEFKEASGQMSILGKDEKKTNKKSVYGYCVAIGNEGGGKLVLGVTNKIDSKIGTRRIVGTNAIMNLQKTEEEIYEVLNRKIQIEEIATEEGKVQVVHIPPHPTGEAFKFYGVHLMRNGEKLVEMDAGTLSKIINETKYDFSAQINPDATLDDLDMSAVELLKKRWVEKSKNKDLETLTSQEVLEKLLLITQDGITNACILLVGKPNSLARLIPCSEIFLEWRADDKKTEFDLRDIIREPYITAQEKVWSFVNSRNTRVPFKQGFFEKDIWAYDEDSIREAALNAFAHREYRDQTAPTYIRVSPNLVTIKSSGGFVSGVNKENALYIEGHWRNRRLMEALGMVGLVERAGIGLDRIYKASISQGKGLPDFDGTTPEFVVINIPAKIKDVNFVYYLQKVAKETALQIDTVKDFIELEEIREHGRGLDKGRLHEFIKNKIVEKTGKGRGMKYVLAKNFYEFIDERGEYTRKKWLNKGEQKQLILNHLKDYGQAKISDFKSLFKEKSLTNQQLNILLTELAPDGVYFDGPRRSRSGYWKLRLK